MTAFSGRPTPSTAFHIKVDKETRRIQPTGEMDLATAPLVLAAAKSLLTDFIGDLTIDLSGLSFADSSLLNVVVQLNAYLDHDDAELRLINPTAAAKRLFLASGLSDLLA